MLSVVWIGVPLLLGAVAACRRIAEHDRRAANALLDAHIPPLARPADPRARPRDRSTCSPTAR